MSEQVDMDSKVIDAAEETVVVNAETDFDLAFGEVVEPALEDKGTPDDTKDQKADEKSEEEKTEKTETKEAKKEVKAEEKSDESNELKADLAREKQRAEDNQAAFTRSQQKLSEMEAKIAELEKAGETQEPDLSEEAREFLDDNPAAVKFIQSEIKKGLKDVQPAEDNAVDPRMIAASWGVKMITAGHPDYINFIGEKSLDIPANPEFVQFFINETGLEHIDVDNPKQFVDTLVKFKSKLAEADASKHDKKKADDALELENDAQATIEDGQSTKDIKPPEPDKEDFDGGFDEEASKADKK